MRVWQPLRPLLPSSLEATWAASWGRKEAGLLGHPNGPLPRWQSAQLSELSLSQSHLPATAIKPPFISTSVATTSELGGLCSFHFRKKTGWISQRGEVEGDLARWRCLWVAALFLLSPGSCDMVTEHKQPRASAALGVVPLVMVSYRKWPPPCTQVFLGPSNNCQGLVWNPQHGLAV